MTHPHDLQKLITTYERRLQCLKEQRALRGLDTPPEVFTEIEDIEAEIQRLETELARLTSGAAGENEGAVQRVLVYLHGDIEELSPERQAAAVRAFAAVIGIPPQAVTVYRVKAGSVLLDLELPWPDVQRLRQLLRHNSARLGRLAIKEVVLFPDDQNTERWQWTGDGFFRLHQTGQH